MYNQSIFKKKVLAAVLCWVTLASVTGLSQMAHADDSWASLLKPLVNTVILPAVNSGIDKMEVRMQRKSSSQVINTAQVINTSTPSITPAVANNASSSNTVTTTTSGDIVNSGSDTAGDDWKLPEEPTH